jgi:hypothetical protein
MRGITEWPFLTGRAKAAVEAVADGTPITAAAAAAGVTHQAVSRWLKLPEGAEYRAWLERQRKGRIYALSAREIERRMELGPLPMGDLLAVWKGAMPSEPREIIVRRAVEDTLEAQSILVRLLEEHVPREYLAPILAELGRVREHHRAARDALAR